jgi:CheY-like chemotaxis protein
MGAQPCNILLIENNPDDVFLIRRALNSSGLLCSVQWVFTADDAVCYIKRKGAFFDCDKFPLPDIIITDLRVQQDSDFRLLTLLQDQPSFKGIPVICMTGSEYPNAINQIAKWGIACIPKTPDSDKLIEAIRQRLPR